MNFPTSILFGSSEPVRSAEISRKLKAGKLRKLATKLYTEDLRSDAAEVVRRHRLEIAAHFYPGAVISHRSALEGTLSPGGKLHLSLPGKFAPVRKLPGLEIRLWEGPVPQPEDVRTDVGEGQPLYTASHARAVLENFQIARARGNDESKTLSNRELEQWFDRQLRLFGDDWLIDLETRATNLAKRFGWQRELDALLEFITAMRGENSSYRFVTDLARARAKGRPYDPDRIRIFNELHAQLAATQFVELPAPPVVEMENRAFWEAYFSNFIEGTRFSVEEAREIVTETGAAIALHRKRPEDAHDVLETYRLIVDPRISGAVPASAPDFLELLKRRHARMMASRASVEPGVFKTVNNEVGSRIFVAPALVPETLSRGWLASRTLQSNTARAVFLLFVVAEVHPFRDGNGRISRLGMNAELEQAGCMRLIIPTSLRNDYISVLEALTANGNPRPFIAFAHKLIDVNQRMPFGSFEETYAYFRKSGALDEPASASFNLLSHLQ